jgi:hypothetical protein
LGRPAREIVDLHAAALEVIEEWGMASRDLQARVWRDRDRGGLTASPS